MYDVVEDKVLIGDRPKLSNDPENKIPLNERLLIKRDNEEEDVRLSYHMLECILTLLFLSLSRKSLRFTTSPLRWQTGSGHIMIMYARRCMRCSPVSPRIRK